MNRRLYKLFGKFDTQLKYAKGTGSTLVDFGYWIEKIYKAPVGHITLYEFKPLYREHYADEICAKKAKSAWRDFQYINSLQITRRY
tara:strand:- start:1501 stop:1758 length:258 start_codon:yes stop_codon:yes gene_type:complete